MHTGLPSAVLDERIGARVQKSLYCGGGLGDDSQVEGCVAIFVSLVDSGSNSQEASQLQQHTKHRLNPSWTIK